MRISSNILEEIKELGAFKRFFENYVQSVLGEARLFPRLSMLRVEEVHGAWLNDLDRVGENERRLTDGLDHFKRAGHLAFWVRRMLPLVEAIDTTSGLGDSEGYPLTQQEKKFRELLFGYHNEYVSFDLGFQICKFYETAVNGENSRAGTLVLTEDFYNTICHFLKYKTVSPHSITMIYKSLFC